MNHGAQGVVMTINISVKETSTPEPEFIRGYLDIRYLRIMAVVVNRT